jgi:hypothetical protein
MKIATEKPIDGACVDDPVVEPGVAAVSHSSEFPRPPMDDKIKQVPKEIGVMLITAGIVGVILPGPGAPAIIAGGLALWPAAFGRLESWLSRRNPDLHRKGVRQINRFLDDLERRYPDAVRS